MSGKARVLTLLTLQERARIAGTMADLRAVAQQKAEADRMVERLTEAVARQGKGAGVRLATEVMAERAMAAQLLSEVDRQRDRQAALSVRMAQEQARLAEQEYRQQKLMEQAGAARRSEAEDRQAARDAAMPTRRR